MNTGEYKSALKKFIDDTTDESLLKRWKTQMEEDVAQANSNTKGSNLGQSENSQNSTSENSNDTAGYDIVESGLGIDE